MHILVLTDRDWTHPQGGGTGANLYGQVSHWLALGHRVSIVAAAYEGSVEHERMGALEIHRVGGRSTVFPHVIWRGIRGKLPEADVVLEVVNGITFLSPLWMRTPSVTLVHHVHRQHYVEEMGRKGAVAALLLETLPLKLLYARSRFSTISNATADEMAALGIDRERIEVNYLGVDLDPLAPGERAAQPTLLFLGRLKRYKHIEVLLDVLEQIPDAVLEIAGEGDHRPELERQIAERGLADRVRMLGYVDEATKIRLLQHAWVNLTASSAEGWCLTVMEAAGCATPSAALAVGGLPESIEADRTGLLARNPAELGAQVSRLMHDAELRERLGTQALERARTFTWEGAAERSLNSLEAARAAEPQPGAMRALAQSDTGRAAGLASAVIATNIVALLFTVVFARLLGADDYGSLAALLSAFIILMVPGSALQIAVAREISTQIAAGDPNPGSGVRRWLGRLGLATLLVAAAAVPLREPLAAVINVDEAWAAAAVPVSSMIWMLVCVERGALQGFQHYKAVGLSLVGEAALRIVIAAVLVLAGLGVTGAFLGTGLALAVLAALLFAVLRPLLPEPEVGAEEASRLRSLLAGAWAPVLGMTLLFALQEVHVIVVKHEATSEQASSWAVAAVAAKGIIWVAVGLGMYLLPEVARRAAGGEDARPILARTLGLIAAIAVPMVLVYTVAAEPLLSLVFGPDLTGAAGALPMLAVAMALLSVAYLAVQYMLALGEARFIWVLGAGAVAEVALLLAVGADLNTIALVLSGLQLLCASVLLALSFRSRSRIVSTTRARHAEVV